MKLRITYAGRWFLGLTSLLAGVCAISSNNVIYLIESILIATLFISIWVAARMTAGVSLEFRRAPAIAAEAARDQLRVGIRQGQMRYGIELGEWVQGKFVPLAFVPRVPLGGSVSVGTRRIFPARGPHTWDALAVASSYPFGFFQIIRLKGSGGHRLVWPARQRALGRGVDEQGVTVPRAGTSLLEGEIRPMNPDDDVRAVVWTLSARGLGPLVRARGREHGEAAVILDLRTVDTAATGERRISAAASAFYGTSELLAGIGGSLVILDARGRRTIQGAAEALDHLAELRSG